MTPAIPRRRARVVLGAVLLSFLALSFRLVNVQASRADEFADLARRQRFRTIELPAIRGAIYDRDGRDLAVSIPARTIYGNPKEVTDPAATARALSPVIGVSAGSLERTLRKDRGFVYLARRVEVDVAARVAELDLVGISVLDEAKRANPGGVLAANVLGFTGTDGEGLGGLEFAYERLLRGTPGERILEQDPLGRRIPQGMFEEQPPEPGSDLVLTIDRDLQHAAEVALSEAVESSQAKGGSVVVADPVTGDVLAMATSPTFDPNDISDLDLTTTRNRPVTDTYEPGSVSKLVTAAAALGTGTVTPDTSVLITRAIRVGGKDFTDAHFVQESSIPFSEVISQSSNVGTIRVAMMTGAEPVRSYMERFGYGRPTALGFPGETSGALPSTTRWSTSLPTMAIGQGLSTTLLQLVRAYGIVANDGVMVEPRLVRGWVGPSGELRPTRPARGERVIDAATAEQLRAILHRVTEDGTGTAAVIDGYAVAGKTGTAQKPAPSGGYQGHMASFLGMVPADAPRFVIGVVLDEPTPIWSSIVAAPVFREVGQAALRIDRVPPAATTTRASDEETLALSTGVDQSPDGLG